jgi:hypothetical protein
MVSYQYFDSIHLMQMISKFDISLNNQLFFSSVTVSPNHILNIFLILFGIIGKVMVGRGSIGAGFGGSIEVVLGTSVL